MNDPNHVRTGLQIMTHPILEDTMGMLISDKNLVTRRPSARGVVLGYVPGHGGDVWWVEHPIGTIAAYSYTEFDEAPTPCTS